ncbi:hypothetical protein [Microvirga arsenatis]|uniref:Uncharacterized protein n=1 Tax=Microvirga arsenatis TaxID=2692265 RepID=A0ABW9YTV5_9HYPH|nr:hypothetical protein [Microvirga arsenatis]NBJ09340.1 hypothetical protein [Microvirga arsenatis]NBJ23802.1 hypothetical protein [Microvirga arsenatis]
MTMNDQQFVDVERQLREELTELIARQRGLDRSNRLYLSCREEGLRLIGEYRHRSPFIPVTKIEDVLVRVAENERARRTVQEELAAIRAAAAAQAQAPSEPAADPTVIRLVVRDELTSRAFPITLPVKQVENRWNWAPVGDAPASVQAGGSRP